MNNKIFVKTDKTGEYYYDKRLRKKGNGKMRVIHAPSPKLKQIQREFADWFYQVKKKLFEVNPQITGFLPGRSIVNNAKPHLNKEWVVNLDIKDFFPSTTKDEVLKVLRELRDNRNWFRRFIRPWSCGFKAMDPIILAEYLCLDNGLPQGSPASPILANYIALNKIDKPIMDHLNKIVRFDVNYTRYADDITLSIKNNDVDRLWIKRLASSIINKIKDSKIYEAHPQKTTIKHRSQRQSVTGITVNGKDPGANKELRNKLRAILHNHKRDEIPLSKEIEGTLSFIQSINPQQYEKLLNNYQGELNERN